VKAQLCQRCPLLSIDHPASQQQHGVWRGTMRRAIEMLAAEDLVFTIRARGTFVR
jgi:DNA-binding transcriptional regulator YhcF (GntR family)